MPQTREFGIYLFLAAEEVGRPDGLVGCWDFFNFLGRRSLKSVAFKQFCAHWSAEWFLVEVFRFFFHLTCELLGSSSLSFGSISCTSRNLAVSYTKVVRDWLIVGLNGGDDGIRLDRKGNMNFWRWWGSRDWGRWGNGYFWGLTSVCALCFSCCCYVAIEASSKAPSFIEHTILWRGEPANHFSKLFASFRILWPYNLVIFFLWSINIWPHLWWLWNAPDAHTDRQTDRHAPFPSAYLSGAFLGHHKCGKNWCSVLGKSLSVSKIQEFWEFWVQDSLKLRTKDG